MSIPHYLFLFVFISLVSCSKDSTIEEPPSNQLCEDPKIKVSCDHYAKCMSNCFEYTKLNTVSTNLPDNNIWDVNVDSSQRTWFALRQYGISMVDKDSTWHHYSSKYGTAGFSGADKIIIDDSGTPWALTDGGTKRLENAQWVTVDPYKAIDICYKNGSMWVLRDLTSINEPQSIISYNTQTLNSKDTINLSFKKDYSINLHNFNIDKDGIIYIATNNGLYYYSSKVWHHVTSSNSSLTSNHVTDIEIKDKTIWFISNKYVQFLINGEIHSPDQVMYGEVLYLDKNNDMWLQNNCSYDKVDQLGNVLNSLILPSSSRECFTGMRYIPNLNRFYFTLTNNGGAAFFNSPF